MALYVCTYTVDPAVIANTVDGAVRVYLRRVHMYPCNLVQLNEVKHNVLTTFIGWNI